MIYHDLPISIDKVKMTEHSKCCWGCGATGNLIYCNIVQPLWNNLAVSCKFNHKFIIDPSNPTARYLLKKNKSHMFIQKCVLEYL